MDAGLKEISEDLKRVQSIIVELMENYPAAQKEAIRLEMVAASEHLSSNAFNHENPFENQSLQESLSISSETMHIFYESAYEFHQRSELEKARSLFRFLIFLNPNRVDYWMGLGLCFFMEGRIQDARGTFEIARALDPSNPESYFFLARCLFMLGSYEEALKISYDAENFSKKKANAPCLQATLELQRHIKEMMNRAAIKGDQK
jgi:type III secretion system low calcium response chaperone LcrH/SycD